MSEGSSVASSNQFNCSVCLDILKEPVSTPCGHNYCKTCIMNYWDLTGVYSCPQCRATFTMRPDLRRNTLLADVLEKIKMVSNPIPCAEPTYVECDLCIWKKFKAVKSCLTCLASYCNVHIQSHRVSEALRRHVLVEPTGNLHQKICMKHQKVVQLFCRTDLTGICYLCITSEHRSHDITMPETERAGKQIQLGVMLTEIQRRIEEKHKKLEEVQQNMIHLKLSTERELQESATVFIDLYTSIEKTYKKVTELIRCQEKRETEKAECVVEQLKKEIKALEVRDAELSQLSETDDHIHFLQVYSFLCLLPNEDMTNMVINTDFPSEALRKELLRFIEHLEDICKLEFVDISEAVVNNAPAATMYYPEPNSREDFLKYACQLTLDPNTAYKGLYLSEDNTKVSRSSDTHSYPDHPDRFEFWDQVLCREGLSGCRCYWEVEWSGAAEIGITYKRIKRKGMEQDSRLGYNKKSWMLCCSSYSYSVRHNNKKTDIKAPSCSTIGVYLDWAAGTLSFYSVSDTMTLLYKFKTSFLKPLYPGFCLFLYDSSATICQLNQRPAIDVLSHI
ncbi:tripartite motif-containing protein 16-like [Erpetoichthys calabaricus]|uniref:tripartite motif-containing protein 16-like n=1 Tax=Erpetoichthys calabaricus TaxID=27687 RepID=UPI00223433D7|nr:tripartite motif-containing protein 16-like [Erpetoichthys calabaricus]